MKLGKRITKKKKLTDKDCKKALKCSLKIKKKKEKSVEKISLENYRS